MNNIPAIFEQDVFRPIVPVELPEGTKVNIPAPEICGARTDDVAARQRFLALIGSVDMGRPVGLDNEAIDRDLAKEYYGDR